ncbi:MAG: hydroxyisourate hydrolase [Pseudomonadota bacterium]
MAGILTTHVLDTARGVPAAGLKIELFRVDDGRRDQRGQAMTNADGRTDTPILPEPAFETGTYELLFHAGDYLRSAGLPDGFLDMIPIRFGIAELSHYHVPLLLSPFGYSTYRGS